MMAGPCIDMYGYDLSFFVKRVSVGFTTSFCPAPGAPYQTRNASSLAAVLEHLGQAYAAAAHSIVMLLSIDPLARDRFSRGRGRLDSLFSIMSG